MIAGDPEQAKLTQVGNLLDGLGEMRDSWVRSSCVHLPLRSAFAPSLAFAAGEYCMSVCCRVSCEGRVGVCSVLYHFAMTPPLFVCAPLTLF